MNRIQKLVHSPDLGLLLIRSWVGFVGVFHGSQKLFGLFGGPGIDGFAGYLGQLGVPAPQLNAILAGSAEFFGGLLLIAGLFPRLAAVPFLFTMLVAAFKAHAGKFSVSEGGMEYALTIAFVLAGLIFTGGGRFAVGHFWRPARNAALKPAAA